MPGEPELRFQAGLHLLLCNLMFVLPLVGVLALACSGATSRQSRLFILRDAAVVRLATAGLFVLFSVWMVVSLL